MKRLVNGKWVAAGLCLAGLPVMAAGEIPTNIAPIIDNATSVFSAVAILAATIAGFWVALRIAKRIGSR